MNTTPSTRRVTVRDKWSGEIIAELPRATEQDIEKAVAEADRARKRPWPAHERARVLLRAVELLQERKQAISEVMRRETGFTIKDVENEFARALVTMTLCSQEATRLGGEVVPLDANPGFEQRLAFTIHVPIGIVLAITPFNAPLNTVCHKIGPALAAGNAVILKPAELTPLTARALVQVLYDAGMPEGYLHILYGSGSEVGLRLLRDARIGFTTFTGSTEVGAIVKRETGVSPVSLELGSASVTIVCQDADLDRVARDVASAGFRKAGQVCTSVQLLYAHSSIAHDLVERAVARVQGLKSGDPADAATDVGPLISEYAAAHADALVADALQAGASAQVGGIRAGTHFQPTVLSGVGRHMRIAHEEIFAPVVGVLPFDNLDEAIAIANSSSYGLQAGVYTSSIATIMRVMKELEVGGIIINGTSSTRADGMPYGGMKESGFGKEGPHYAIQEMSIARLVMLGP
ncbi:MAG TPA: aldehyde dehydrogenase family protein [Ktedonosporobacter sp.]|nr:aldehyde dehydrogenase family protein [Ktedonosporobacter sp.]